MKESIDKSNESQKENIQRVSLESSNGGTAQLVDNRSSVAVQRKLQDSMGASSGNGENPIQRKNNTGLPDNLKSSIENLSGYSMDDVKVHYNSSKPAQLQAHAYAQGTDIHLGSGQEKHLAHEAWHVVQQKQGRVKPTRQLKSKVNINDDSGLEKEADVMGEKALQMKSVSSQVFSNNNDISNPVFQTKSSLKNIKGSFTSAKDQPIQRQLSIFDYGKAIQQLAFLVNQAQEDYMEDYGMGAANYSFIPYDDIFEKIKTMEMKDVFRSYLNGRELEDPKNIFLLRRVKPILDNLFGKPLLDGAKVGAGLNADRNSKDNWKDDQTPFGLRFRTKGIKWKNEDQFGDTYSEMREKKKREGISNAKRGRGASEKRSNLSFVGKNILGWFKEWQNSGSTELTRTNVTAGQCLYKIMPVGNNFLSSNSPYYVSQVEFDNLKRDGDILNKLGLPVFSYAHVYAVYKIVALEDTTVYESTVAATDQRVGGYKSAGGQKRRWKSDGGGTQTLIVDSNNTEVWSKISRVHEILDPDEASILAINEHNIRRGEVRERKYTDDSGI